MDGDMDHHAVIEELARSLGIAVATLLCIWHLFNDLEKYCKLNAAAVDLFELKHLFYFCRDAASEEVFLERWERVIAHCALTEKMRNYLGKIFEKRTKWARPWTTASFTGSDTTGISESLHALLSSSKAGFTLFVSGYLPGRQNSGPADEQPVYWRRKLEQRPAKAGPRKFLLGVFMLLLRPC
jgi:hypothetical protein